MTKWGGRVPGGKHALGMPKGKHIFGTVRVGEKGQIVIPKEARRLFGIEAGDMLLILGDEDNGILVTKPDVMNEVAMRLLNHLTDTIGEE
jgi:AbrB family looped-hinge helix DNA binding protein